MISASPRLRMFAGPNGSGKSTIKSVIAPNLLGVYINPDEIEKEIQQFDFLDLVAYGVRSSAEEILPFFCNSSSYSKPSNTPIVPIFSITPFIARSGWQKSPKAGSWR